MFENILISNAEDDNNEIEAVSFEENEEEIYDFPEKTKINNILRSELTSYTNGLQIESLINSLVTQYYLIPKFQRKYIWKKSQVANLALSLIKDIPIPPIYLYVNERKKQVILDGQQRATSLFLYFNDLWYVGVTEYKRLDFRVISDLNLALTAEENILNNLVENESLNKKEKTQKVKEAKEKIKNIKEELKKQGVARTKFYVEDKGVERDISFSSFSEDEKEFLKRKRLDITIVDCRSKNAPKVYAEIFKLLNSGGKLLSAQEVRNGVYWELFLYDRLFEVNKKTQWREIYGKESDVSKDVEILLKILSLNYYTTFAEKISIDYDGTFNWSNIMEDYSDIAGTWSNENVEKQISLLINFLNNIKNIDRSVATCNKAVFEAAFVAYTKLNFTCDIEYTWLCSLGSEKEFQKGEVLSNKQSVEKRLNKALQMIKGRYGV